jgi:hypothetical protein
MRSYCYERGGKIEGGYQQNYGYIAETEKTIAIAYAARQFRAIITPTFFAYDKRQQELNMKNAEKPIIARTSYANGEVFEHTDPEAFF